MTKDQLKEKTTALLKESKKLTMRWDAGGDEAFAYIAIDGKETDFSDEFGEEMSMYLTEYLKIPDAGEFTMEGEGNIFEEKGEIHIDYESTAATYFDGKEWVEEDDPMIVFSDTVQLFK